MYMNHTKPVFSFRFMLLLGLTVLAANRAASALAAWEPVSQTAPASLTSAVVDPLNPARLVLASKHEVMLGPADGPWKRFAMPFGLREDVQNLLIFPRLSHSIFVRTRGKVLKLEPETGKWTSVFRAGAGEEVLSFAILPEDNNHWLTGTSRSLMESDDGGRTWARISGWPRESGVPLIGFFKERLLVGAQKTMLISGDLEHFRPVLSLPAAEEEPQAETGDSQEAPAAAFHTLTASNNEHRLWAGTRCGVFESRDLGITWAALPTTGLRDPEVLHLVYSETAKALAAATRTGIFVYHFQSRHWQELYSGLSDTKARALFLFGDEKDKLGALTRDGFVFLPLVLPEPQNPERLPVPDPAPINLFRRMVSLEPSAREVQEAAIRHANVSNRKTRRWQMESRLKALVPRLSFSHDFSRNNSVDLDRGSTSEADVYIQGPDDVSNDVSFDLSWDLADLIWSTDQTSIDSREKLMVELRHDLMSEVTRLYFERRRLQLEILTAPDPEALDRFARLTRLEELSALLDAMTGGFFGHRLSSLYRRYPEMESLWDFRAPPSAPSSHAEFSSDD